MVPKASGEGEASSKGDLGSRYYDVLELDYHGESIQPRTSCMITAGISQKKKKKVHAVLISHKRMEFRTDPVTLGRTKYKDRCKFVFELPLSPNKSMGTG